MTNKYDLSKIENRKKFYRTKLWSDIRLQKLYLNPICEICQTKGIIEPATDVHHITDISKKPTWENATNLEGLQSLCHSCHSQITVGSLTNSKIFEPTKVKFKF